MANPSEELVSYVRSGLAAGNAPEAIRASLKAAGWAAADVDAAFAGLSTEVRAGKKHLPWWRITLIVIGLIILLITSAGLGYRYILKKTGASLSMPFGTVLRVFVGTMRKANDDAKVDLTDLEVSPVSVAAENNAYIDSSAITIKHDPSAKTSIMNQLSGEDEWDQSFVDGAVNTSADSIKLFMAATQKPEYQAPNMIDPQSAGPTTLVISYGPIRELARLVALDAISKAKNGNSDDGADEALVVASYGQKIATSKNLLIGYLVGLGIKKVGLDALGKIIAMGQISADRAQKIDQVLSSFTDTGSGLADGLRLEFWNFNNGIEYTLKHPEGESGEAQQTAKASYLFEPNKTVNIAGRQYRELVKLATAACRKFEPPTLDQRLLDKADKFEVENSIGISISKIGLVSQYSTLTKRCDDMAQVAAVRASLAALAVSGNTALTAPVEAASETNASYDNISLTAYRKKLAFTVPESIRPGTEITLRWTSDETSRHYSDRVYVCLIGFDDQRRPIDLKGEKDTCHPDMQVLISTALLSSGEYRWKASAYADRFISNPKSFALSVRVIDTLPTEGRSEWAGLISESTSNQFTFSN